MDEGLPTGIVEEPLIAALATASGPGAIAIVRLSGAGAIEAARGMLCAVAGRPVPRRLFPAVVLHESGEPLDDALVAFFPAPRSYTGENMVEIHCHGGLAISRAVEERALTAGARRALPGEFTARAVRNRKMDMLDAEALAALLSADDSAGLLAARTARKTAQSLRRIQAQLAAALAEARGASDYPLETQRERLTWRAVAADGLAALRQLAEGGPGLEGLLRDGVTVAILGPPNAGKSSLFNALLGEPRALVDSAPGTTRDAVPAALLLAGRRVTLLDTAGLRDAEGLEARGIARALRVAEESSLCVWVEDVSAMPLQPPRQLGALPLRVETKADLPPHPARGPASTDTLRVSVQSGAGLPALWARLKDLLPTAAAPLTGRQQQAIEASLALLGEIPRLSDDLAVEELDRAAAALALLRGAGEQPAAALLVYERFCVGK